jgi:hypothetical protein
MRWKRPRSRRRPCQSHRRKPVTRLRHWSEALRDHVPSPPEEAPPASPRHSPARQAIVDDLERRLEEIVVRREGPSDLS